jgi:hypothetical protein
MLQSCMLCIFFHCCNDSVSYGSGDIDGWRGVDRQEREREEDRDNKRRLKDMYGRKRIHEYRCEISFAVCSKFKQAHWGVSA